MTKQTIGTIIIAFCFGAMVAIIAGIVPQETPGQMVVMTPTRLGGLPQDYSEPTGAPTPAAVRTMARYPGVGGGVMAAAEVTPTSALTYMESRCIANGVDGVMGALVTIYDKNGTQRNQKRSDAGGFAGFMLPKDGAPYTIRVVPPEPYRCAACADGRVCVATWASPGDIGGQQIICMSYAPGQATSSPSPSAAATPAGSRTPTATATAQVCQVCATCTPTQAPPTATSTMTRTPTATRTPVPVITACLVLTVTPGPQAMADCLWIGANGAEYGPCPTPGRIDHGPVEVRGGWEYDAIGKTVKRLE